MCHGAEQVFFTQETTNPAGGGSLAKATAGHNKHTLQFGDACTAKTIQPDRPGATRARHQPASSERGQLTPALAISDIWPAQPALLRPLDGVF